MSNDIKICEEGGGKGFVLPFSNSEHEVNDGLRAILYGLALLYFFLGVSIVADTFMGAIEVITSRRRQVMLTSGRIITVRVWNDTVANLTLMALGSSAPEILLAVTELFKKKMYSGDLGPATIVGSASFNLLIIVGLCICVIPSNETRKVREVPVFIVTVLFMFLAYIWLVLIVSVISPKEIEIWEALVTLLMLPVLVWLSYLADIGKFGELGKHIEVRDYEVNRVCNLLGTMDRNDKRAIRDGLSHHPHFVTKLENPTSSDIDDLRRMVKKFAQSTKSRAARRIDATRGLTGGKRILWELTPTFGLLHRVSGVSGMHVQDVPVALPKGKGPPIVQFAADSQTVSAGVKNKTVVLNRCGDCSQSIVVEYVVGAEENRQHGSMMSKQSSEMRGSSLVGTPKSRQTLQTVTHCSLPTGVIYHRASVTFDAEERHKFLEVEVPQAAASMRCFSVSLIAVKQQDGNGMSQSLTATSSKRKSETSSGQRVAELVSIGAINKTVVTIAEDKEAPNRLAFAYERLLVPGTEEHQCLEVMVQRLDGCMGTVGCTYRTESLTAVPGYDYAESSGKLEFPEGVTERFIDIDILPKGRSKKKDEFLLVLEEPEGHVEFNPRNDGGLESEILTLQIGSRKMVGASATATKVFTLLDEALNFNEILLGSHEYSSQFRNAIYCNGSPEEQADASAVDWVFHILALPWKLIFMFIPPTTYFHGWLCFWSSLVFIGGLTALIGDIAEIFGCCLGFTNLITAISFVALGTSMPDLFASKVAATQDTTADASIVNVTGSNSVNVFLGLGMPWSIGAIYWRSKSHDSAWQEKYPDFAAEHDYVAFVVPSGDLGLSVGVFTAVAIMALIILFVRRRHVGAELGGEVKCKFASGIALAVLWVAYLTLSAWWSLRQDDAETGEIILVFSVVGGIALVPCVAAIGFALVLKRPSEDIRHLSDRQESSYCERAPTNRTVSEGGCSISEAAMESERPDESGQTCESVPPIKNAAIIEELHDGCNDSREEPLVACESANGNSVSKETECTKTPPTPSLDESQVRSPLGIATSDEHGKSLMKTDRAPSPPPPAEEGRHAAEVRATCCATCCLTSTYPAETVAVESTLSPRLK